MKLLMITGDRNLAAGKHGAFYNTLEEFHKYWERIDIICPRIKDSGSKTESLFGNVFVHPSPWPIWCQSFWILKKGREIYQEHKFGLFTVHEYPPFYNGIGARMLWRKIRVPYVLEIMHIVGYPNASSVKESFYRFISKLFIKHDASKAKAVRVINQKETPEFLIKAGLPSKKLAHIPAFYIDLDVFRPKECEKEYDLIFIGRLVKNKGIDLFLDAVKELGVRAVIVGDGPLKENLKFKIKSLKLEDKITFYGWVSNPQEVAGLLNKSKLLVMPSYNEGGPRVVLEAMACGVPVLATPVGIVSDVIKDGETGRIIKWDAEDIFQKAKIILDDKNEYNKYRIAGIEIVKQFEKKSAIKNYADSLLDIINEK